MLVCAKLKRDKPKFVEFSKDLGVNAPGGGHTFNVRLIGRKLVPGGIKKTVKNAAGQSTVTGLAAA